MFESRMGRQVKKGQIVRVYKNLHKNKFSIVDDDSGLVLGYADRVGLFMVEYEVNQKGREKVLATKRKSVHAYLVGNYIGCDEELPQQLTDDWKPAYYNPYKTEFFQDEKGNKITFSDMVILQDGKVFYRNSPYSPLKDVSSMVSNK